jgi:hypothetical protein
MMKISSWWTWLWMKVRFHHSSIVACPCICLWQLKYIFYPLPRESEFFHKVHTSCNISLWKECFHFSLHTYICATYISHGSVLPNRPWLNDQLIDLIPKKLHDSKFSFFHFSFIINIYMFYLSLCWPFTCDSPLK